MDDTPLFSIRNITKTFPNGFTALHGVTLDIYAGQCVLIAGSNGSGKTLLMRIMLDLAEPSAGDVLFRRQPLNKAGTALRRQVGLVFQDADAQILGETVAEDVSLGPRNLKMAKTELAERVENALRAVELTDKKDFPPRSLSGGEKRRLAVAGILAMGCETIIFDEPFANMDWFGVVQVQKIIVDLKESDKTIIILTHELEKALLYADRLVILHGGRVQDDGTPDTVLDRLRPEYGVRDPRSTAVMRR